MSTKHSEIIVVGGGVAGSALSISLARAGVDVLLLEAETAFRDRVRGEILFPWGVAEARRLGIHELLLSAGATPLPYRDTYVGGRLRKRSAFAEESEIGEIPLSFNHATVQERLVDTARNSGARVIRGAEVEVLQSGRHPEVSYRVDGQLRHESARLVVGADGRTSRVRRLGGFEVKRGTPGLMTSGVALTGVSMPADGLAAAFNARERESAALLPQHGGRVRAYLTSRAITGEPKIRSIEQFSDRLVEAGLPVDALRSAEAIGPLATFDGTPKWVDLPYRDGVALIGDAASTSDPAFGQGIALALRDVTVLAKAFVETADSRRAGFYYAREHSAYSAANRFVSGVLGEAQFQEGACADQLRFSILWRMYAGRLRAVHLDGPDDALQELLATSDGRLAGARSGDRLAIAC